MSRRLAITGGKIVRRDSVESGVILIADGKIADADYKGEMPDGAEVYDARGGYVLPAFIDIHAHGGGGFDFVDRTRNAFDAIFRTHLSHGTALLCPTLTACEIPVMFEFLELCEGLRDTAGFGGAHLEGPFLSPQMCGAQNLSRLIKPDGRLIDGIAEHSGVISRITAAPEIEGVEALAKRMGSLGLGLSIGHSAADAETVRRAFTWGFNQITHLYCSTSRQMKRNGRVYGGIVEAALADGGCYVELIGDGHHISREGFLMTLKCMGADRICAVSDAMRAAGAADTDESYLGEMLPENRVIIEDGVAMLPDRSSFAGSLAVGDMMVSSLCGEYGLPLTVVSRMMSETPAALLGLDRSRGKLLPGYCADITVLNPGYKTEAVFVSGNKAYEASVF